MRWRGGRGGELALGQAIVAALLVFPAGTAGNDAPVEDRASSGGIATTSGYWTRVIPRLSPNENTDPVIAWDAGTENIVLFGGRKPNDNLTPIMETWTYALISNTWTNKSPPTSPSGRGGYSFVFDQASMKGVIFGGRSAKGWGAGDDTWAYETAANSWVNMSPSAHPTPRAHYAMAYDFRSDRIVLFGGLEIPVGNFLNDTWAYDLDANRWEKRAPRTAPGPLFDTKAAYDPVSDRVLLFGGRDENVQSHDEVWAYDYEGDSWAMLSPPTRPPARHAYSLTFDIRAKRLIAFGGFGVGNSILNDTWIFDPQNVTWEKGISAANPSARYLAGLAYHGTASRSVLFGGGIPVPEMAVNDTWLFDVGAAQPFAPTVVLTVPADGATNVPVKSNITVEFDQRMAEPPSGMSFSASPTITVTGVEVNYGTKFTWSHVTSDLQPGTTYAVTISTVAKSEAGINMAKPYTFRFTTASSQPPYPEEIVFLPGASQVVVGKNKTLEYWVKDNYGDPIDVAGGVTVDPTGIVDVAIAGKRQLLVKGLQPGSAKVTVAIQGLGKDVVNSTWIQIVAPGEEPGEPAKIVFTAPRRTLRVGEEVVVTYAVLDAAGKPVSALEEWSHAPDDVALVLKDPGRNFRVKALKEGDVTITVTARGPTMTVTNSTMLTVLKEEVVEPAPMISMLTLGIAVAVLVAVAAALAYRRRRATPRRPAAPPPPSW